MLRPYKGHIFLKNLLGTCLKRYKLLLKPPSNSGGSEVKVPHNWGLKAFQAYMKRGRVQDLQHFSTRFLGKQNQYTYKFPRMIRMMV